MRTKETVSLTVESSTQETHEREVSLNLLHALRVLEGRREVWLAQVTEGESRVVAKKFLIGQKQDKECRREINGLRELLRRGIPGPKLLFDAMDSQGNFWVVAEYIDNAIELGDVMFRGVQASRRAAAIKRFVQNLLLHWRNGVYQTDAHYKNFLWDGNEIYTIDVGSIRFLNREVSSRARRRTLVRMCHRFSKETWSIFLSSYLELASTQAEKALGKEMHTEGFRRLVERGRKSELKSFWAKCQRDCSEFERIERNGLLVLRERDRNKTISEAFINNPESIMSSGKRLKSGNTCTVQLVELEGQKFVVKRYNPKSLVYRIRHAFTNSRAIKTWANSKLLKKMEINTANCVMVLEEREFGMLKKGYVVMEHVDGETLNLAMRSQGLTKNVRKGYIEQIVVLFEKLYRNRVVHGDMKAKNLLVNDSGIHLIDIDGMKPFLDSANFQNYFEKDRQRFLENWNDLPEMKQLLDSQLSKFK